MYIETVTLPGFNFIYKQREKGRGGGVGFYISESLNYKLLMTYLLLSKKLSNVLPLKFLQKNLKKHYFQAFTTLLLPLRA